MKKDFLKGRIEAYEACPIIIIYFFLAKIYANILNIKKMGQLKLIISLKHCLLDW